MAYRIKGWTKFQHFKDRRPPWIKLYRDLLDDPEWYQLDPKAAKVLVMLWLIASEAVDKSGALPDDKRLSFRLRIDEKALQSIMSQLCHWIDIIPISSGYQVDTPEGEGETETEKEKALSCKQDESHPMEDSKPKINGHQSEAVEVLNFLNAKLGKNFRPVDANLKLIVARLKEGATVQECRSVIAMRISKWKGTDQEEYLRPKTLFNATNFANYSGQLFIDKGEQ